MWRERCVERQRQSGVIPASTELSPRPDWVPAWDSLSSDERRVHARYMEAFAGMLSHTDAQIGRLVDFLRATGDLDNTLVMLMSDNGASSEGGVTGSLNDLRTWNGLRTSMREALERIDEIGGPTIHNNYPWGWTVAGNTPFRRWKREVHEGGVADPLVIHWPAGISDPGTLRTQYCHAIDLAPTILDACGVAAPAAIGGVTQSPIEGSSLPGVMRDARHGEVRSVQYYEMFGCRALYRDGSKAVTYHPIQADDPPLSDENWELFDVRADPSECHDLAALRPELLAELIEQWWREAEAHQVLPIDNRPFSEMTLSRPRSTPERRVTTLRPSRGMIPETSAPDTRNRSHSIVATFDVGEAGARGVLASQGSGLSGWVFYCDRDTVSWHIDVANKRHSTVSGAASLGPGRHVVELHYSKTSAFAGEAAIVVDGAEVARGDVDYSHITRVSVTGAGLSIGRSDPYPVSDDPAAAQPFSGRIDTVVIRVEGLRHSDESEVDAAIAVQ